MEEKKAENNLKKVFQPAFRWAQHPKAGQNTQHMLWGNLSIYEYHAYDAYLINHYLWPITMLIEWAWA